MMILRGNVFLPFGKNALSTFGIPFVELSIVCVVANGVVRFSWGSFGCATFYFWRIIG